MSIATPWSGAVSLEALIETLPLPALVVDHQSRVLCLSPPLTELMGQESGHLIGVALESIVRCAGHDVHGLRSSPWREVTSGTGGPWDVSVRRGDGTSAPLALHAAALPADALPSRWLLCFTELKRGGRGPSQVVHAAVRLEAMADLAKGLANDLNNSLAAVTGHVELALTELETSPLGAADSLRIAREAAAKAAGHVRRLVSCVQPLPSTRRPVDPCALIERCAAALTQELPDTIRVRQRFEHGDWTAFADLDQLADVLLNLGYNARDAMPEGGDLLIATTRIARTAGRHDGPTGGFLRIDVSDTGEGIAPDALPHIFEPFFTTRSSAGRIGLGLAMVYGILKQHGGGIDVQSGPGVGSTFQVYIPRYEGAPVFDAPTEARTWQSDVRILVADDEAHVRRAVRTALQREGFQVIEAADGAAALRAATAADRPVALVVLDIAMPKLSGWEVLRELKQRNVNVKVIVASGYAVPDAALVADGVEPDAVLNKPYELAELVKTVCGVLRPAG